MSAPVPENTAGRAPAEPPLPGGFRVHLDPDAKELEPGVWYGGQPARVMKFSGPGQEAWAELRDGPVRTRAGGRLARRLTDAGLAHPVPPAGGHRPDTTVVVPVYGRADRLERCLTALGRRYPVVVVDDGSDHGSDHGSDNSDADAIRAVAARHDARLVRLAVNAGPGAARNAGLAQVRTPVVAFVDSDTVPGGDWLERVVAHLADPAVAAVAPRVTPLAGRSFGGRYALARSSLDLGRRPARVVPYTRVSYLPTAALVARTAALESVASGGYVFDPALRVGEDVDLVWRLHEAGWRLRYEPAAQVPHAEPERLSAALRRRFSYGTSAAALARKHPDLMAPLLVFPWFTGTVAAALARRPVLAAAAYAGAAATIARRLRAADVPLHGLLPAVGQGVRQTWLGTGRYAVQFATPGLLAVLARGAPGRKLAAASLLLGPAVTDWRAARPDLDLGRYVVAHLADDIAYGGGVIAGCYRRRTLVPLRPQFARPDLIERRR